MFWSIGYPSVTAIEDFDGRELNPNYHTVNDTLSSLNMTFFTYHIKASVGTVAHLAIPIENKIYLPAIFKWLGFAGTR
jgi:hypothetical protein